MNVAIVSRLRMGIANLRERLAGREDSEHVDALVRIALVLVICTMPYYGSVLLKRLRAAQDKAALANAAQKRLLSLMRYDIRNLLTSITDNNAALRKTPLTTRQLDLIDPLGTACETLLSQLDHWLDIARIETEKTSNGRARLDLYPAINKDLKTAASTPGTSVLSEPVLDHAVLLELEKCGNSRHFLAQVVDAFESDMLRLVERLKMVVKSEDWSEIAEISHAIEETARDSGAAAIVRLIDHLKSLDAVAPGEREKRIGELCACFAATLDAMREFLRQRQMRPPADVRRAPLLPRPS
ncbi:MAG: hypothetical protein HYU44_08755 [Betaproteobacteria bacterium]|nr:hypothetical protein [Betaproteobacteria bacterium]